MDNDRLCSSGSMDSDYLDFSHLGNREFSETKHTSLPPELKEQLRNLQTNCAFGIFPEIYRAWMTVDSDLFLWNFEFNKDLADYDHIENTILKVELVNLRPGVFDPRFAQALVVATTGDLYLLGVGFIDESRQETVFGQIDHKNPNLCLVLEEIARVSLDGVVVTDLACTVDGRVFFSADNGVYECDYSRDFWIGITVIKSKRSKIQFFSRTEKITKLAVDDTRHILYSLSDHAKIVVYDLGSNGQEFQKAAENSLDQIVEEHRSQINCDTSFVKEFVSISVIPSTRSLHGYLEAITTCGIRIFFTCLEQSLVEKGKNRFTQNSVRPQCLRAIHFRLPTGNPSLLLQNKTNVYFGKTMNDTTIIALSTAREESALFAFSSMNFTYTNRFIESYSNFEIQKTKVWSVTSTAEILSLEMCKVRETTIETEEEVELVPAIQPPQFSQQHIFPVDNFHIVTSDGICEAERPNFGPGILTEIFSYYANSIVLSHVGFPYIRAPFSLNKGLDLELLVGLVVSPGLSTTTKWRSGLRTLRPSIRSRLFLLAEV